MDVQSYHTIIIHYNKQKWKTLLTKYIYLRARYTSALSELYRTENIAFYVHHHNNTYYRMKS